MSWAMELQKKMAAKTRTNDNIFILFLVSLLNGYVKGVNGK
jgi:hypothetical protein